MSDFGDIRSICHAGVQDEHVLVEALASYSGRVPAPEVIAYIRKAWGWCPATKWQGGSGRTFFVLYAHKHEHPTLSAYLKLGEQEIEVLRLEDAESRLQAAIKPIRKVALDQHWLPLAKRLDSPYMRRATRKLYACLDDPTLIPETRPLLSLVLGQASGSNLSRDLPPLWGAATMAGEAALLVPVWEAAKYSAHAFSGSDGGLRDQFKRICLFVANDLLRGAA